MLDIRKVRFDELLQPRAVRQGTRDSQSVNVSELPPAKRLDGEVVREGEIAYSGGMYCEVWAGKWKKGVVEIGVERVEKVSPGLTAAILLI